MNKMKEKLQLIGIILLLSSVISACGGGDDGGGAFYFTPPDGFVSLEDQLAQDPLMCATGAGDCPYHTGMIYSFAHQGRRDRLGMCSGFPIRPDVIATNEHCIPEYLHSGAVSCKGNLAIRFVSADGRTHVFQCEEVLAVSNKIDPRTGDVSDFRRDYAFFRINPVANFPLQPMRFSTQASSQDQNVVIQSMTPNNGLGRGGFLENKSCRVSFGSLVDLVSVSPWSHLLAVRACDVVQGNSGSPVVNSQNQVIGIIQGEIKLDNLRANRSHRNLLEKLGVSTSREFNRTFVMTNTQCIDHPLLRDQFRRDQCEAADKLSWEKCHRRRQYRERQTEGASSGLISPLDGVERWQRELPEYFKNDFYFYPHQSAAWLQPKCIVESALPIRNSTRGAPIESTIQYAKVYSVNREVDATWRVHRITKRSMRHVRTKLELNQNTSTSAWTLTTSLFRNSDFGLRPPSPLSRSLLGIELRISFPLEVSAQTEIPICSREELAQPEQIFEVMPSTWREFEVISLDEMDSEGRLCGF